LTNSVSHRMKFVFIMGETLDCPDCDIKPGTKDSKICEDHLKSISELLLSEVVK